MSTCPENDIHSVYLDGELPLTYVARYEAHIAECSECRRKLEELKKVRSVFSNDSTTLFSEQKELDESFERLQTRMSYSKVVKKSNVFNLPKENLRSSLKYVLSGAVAAAVVAFILPVRVSQNNSAVTASQQAAFQPVARTNMVSPATLTSLGNDSATLATLFADESSASVNIPSVGDFSSGFYSPYARTASQNSVSTRSSLASYNVFGPVPQDEQMVYMQKKGFSFHMSSPLGNISLEIGSGN